MKKLIALLIVALMTSTLMACKSEPTTEQGTDKEGYIVGVIAKETKSDFHAKLNGKAKETLDKYVLDGVIGSWFILDGQEDASIQVALIDDAINMGADCIVLLPAEEDGSAPIVAKCAENNIPCIVINSKTSNTDELATAFVTSDDIQAGEMMAQFVVEQLPDGAGYCHIQGIIGNSAQIQRGEGIHNILDLKPEWKKLDEQSNSWDAAKGVSLAEDWITKFGDELKVIICDDDTTSASVQLTCNSLGREDIICIGVNGGDVARSMIKDGTMLCTIFQDGEAQMFEGLSLIEKLSKGESVEGGTRIIDYVYITKDNVSDYQ